MSDRLNDDVLLLVLGRLADPHRDISTVSPKRRALLQVCLASRRLCRLAQPILWRHFVLRSLDQVAAIEEGRISYFLYSSPSVVTISTSDELLPEEGLAALDLFPNLVEVRVLGHGEWTSLELLARLKGLLRLRLHKIRVEPLSTSPSLPQLEALELKSFCMTPYDLRRWLRPSHLPRLKTLVLPTRLRDPASGWEGDFSLDQVLFRGALPTLTCIQAHGAPLNMDGSLAHGTAPLVLFANPLGASSLPRHSVVRPWLYEARETVLKELIKAAWGTPRRTYRGELPFVLFMPDLVAGPPCAERARRVEPDLDELERACKERGVCLVRYKALRAARAAERLEPPVEVERYVRQLRAAQRRK